MGLLAAIGGVFDTDVRAIRRGRWIHLAQRGTTTKDLALLSGHRRVDTLLRYLGWGVFDGEAEQAANRRETVERGPQSDAHVTAGEAPLPTKMGPFLGQQTPSAARL
jgi:hypothetical protein